jgi:hypothetical protein
MDESQLSVYVPLVTNGCLLAGMLFPDGPSSMSNDWTQHPFTLHLLGNSININILHVQTWSFIIND